MWIWEELPELEREVLAPFGFSPRPGQRFESLDRFLPAENLGYLRWLPEGKWGDYGAVFEVDDAVEESIEDMPARPSDAAMRYAALMAAGRCRRQLCVTDLAPLPTGTI